MSTRFLPPTCRLRFSFPTMLLMFPGMKLRNRCGKGEDRLSESLADWDVEVGSGEPSEEYVGVDATIRPSDTGGCSSATQTVPFGVNSSVVIVGGCPVV